jgi:hypothetical protein
VGQGITDLGEPDPRKPPDNPHRLDPLLKDFLKTLEDQDDPTKRVYPANLTILRAMREIMDFTHEEFGLLNAHSVDLAIVGFYWLLRPGEYVYSARQEDKRTSPFYMRDVALTFNYNALQLNACTLTSLNDEQVRTTSSSSLHFSDQKNGVRGESISHCANSDPFFCPAKALARIVQRLLRYNAPPDSPLYKVWNPRKQQFVNVTSTHITRCLQHAAASVQHITGIPPKLLTCRSLRPGGATALLVAGVDLDVVQLLGRWLSDAVLRYLRVQAATRTLSQSMLHAGSYTFAPDVLSTAHKAVGKRGTVSTSLHLPRETPRNIREAMEHLELSDDLPPEAAQNSA